MSSSFLSLSCSFCDIAYLNLAWMLRALLVVCPYKTLKTSTSRSLLEDLSLSWYLRQSKAMGRRGWARWRLIRSMWSFLLSFSRRGISWTCWWSDIFVYVVDASFGLSRLYTCIIDHHNLQRSSPDNSCTAIAPSELLKTCSYASILGHTVRGEGYS